MGYDNAREGRIGPRSVPMSLALAGTRGNRLLRKTTREMKITNLFEREKGEGEKNDSIRARIGR